MIAKSKQRVMLTLDKSTIATAKAVLSSMGDVKMTLSDLIEVSLGFFLESAINEVKKRELERQAQKGKTN